MTRAKDIQGNSWTDEPEIPNTRRAQPRSQPKAEPRPEGTSGAEEAETPDDETWESGAAEQRPPSDS